MTFMKLLWLLICFLFQNGKNKGYTKEGGEGEVKESENEAEVHAQPQEPQCWWLSSARSRNLSNLE